MMGGIGRASPQFGTATSAYLGYGIAVGNLSYTEVRIFNDVGSQTNNTMLTDTLLVGTTPVNPGNVLIMTQNTGGALSLTFLYTGTDTITQKGFIVERL